MENIHISLKAEEIYRIGDFTITNAMLGCGLVLAVLFFLGIMVKFSLKREGLPSKLQLMVESLYLFLEDIAYQTLGNKHGRKYLGLVITLFLFIIFGSWFGLIPGILHIGFIDHGAFVPLIRAPTTDLNATTALAIIAFLTVQYSGFSSLGIGGYLSKFISIGHGPMNTVLGIFELVSEFTRLISYSFRLFGNIFAGEVLIVVLSALTKFSDANNPNSILNYIGVPIPTLIILMEFFVAMIQSYVFINLMTVFISMASEAPHHDEHSKTTNVEETMTSQAIATQ